MDSKKSQYVKERFSNKKGTDEGKEVAKIKVNRKNADGEMAGGREKGMSKGVSSLWNIDPIQTQQYNKKQVTLTGGHI
jgi:hypothetical protein